MAEGVGFEPTVGLPQGLISSQVPLTRIDQSCCGVKAKGSRLTNDLFRSPNLKCQAPINETGAVLAKDFHFDLADGTAINARAA